jgi:hypothetical protein
MLFYPATVSNRDTGTGFGFNRAIPIKSEWHGVSKKLDFNTLYVLIRTTVVEPTFAF